MNLLARLLLSLAIVMAMLVPLGATAQEPFSDDPPWSAASRVAGPFYEA